jgi:hypothetical protein
MLPRSSLIYHLVSPSFPHPSACAQIVSGWSCLLRIPRKFRLRRSCPISCTTAIFVRILGPISPSEWSRKTFLRQKLKSSKFHKRQPRLRSFWSTFKPSWSSISLPIGGKFLIQRVQVTFLTLCVAAEAMDYPNIWLAFWKS